MFPASGEYSGVVGAGLAALGSRLGWSGGSISDLRTSVGSAAGAVTGPQASATCVTLRLTVVSEDERAPEVRVAVSHDGKSVASDVCNSLTVSLGAAATEVKVDGKTVTFACRPRE